VEAGKELLGLLDGLVRAAPKAASRGLRGTLSIGIQSTEGSWVWWRASFGDIVTCGPAPSFPLDADAVLFLGEASARALLGGDGLPADDARFIGELPLFQKFLDRYVDAQSTFDARAIQRSGR
jgi:hypothetical protein